MPVSSTFSTSAPKSASSSEQKPPGSRRERSSTRMPCRGRLIGPSIAAVGLTLRRSRWGSPASRGPPARSRDGGPCPGHLPGLRDQLAVGARHLAVGQVQVVLQAHPDRAAQRERGRHQHPLVARDADHAPVRSGARAVGSAGMFSTIAARLRAVGGMPPTTPITQSTCSGCVSTPMSISGARLPTWPMSKHSCSGLIPQLVHRLQQLDDLIERVLRRPS